MTSPRIFSEGDLANFLIDRWQAFARELQTTEPVRINELKARYVLTAPRITGNFKIIRHGIVTPGKPESEFKLKKPVGCEFSNVGQFLQAEIDYLEALLAHITHSTHVVFAAPVEGDVELLRY